jgi:hypothetical protein
MYCSPFKPYHGRSGLKTGRRKGRRNRLSPPLAHFQRRNLFARVFPTSWGVGSNHPHWSISNITLIYNIYSSSSLSRLIQIHPRASCFTCNPSSSRIREEGCFNFVACHPFTSRNETWTRNAVTLETTHSCPESFRSSPFTTKQVCPTLGSSFPACPMHTIRRMFAVSRSC